MAFYFFRIWRISLGNGTMWLITLKSDGSGCANNRLNSSNPAIGNEMNRALGHLCAHKNWARRTSWGWWDDWDDTVLQTLDSKFEPWQSEAEHATSRSRRLPTILTFTRGWGRNIFCFFQTAETGNRTPNSGVGHNNHDNSFLVINNNILVWDFYCVTISR